MDPDFKFPARPIPRAIPRPPPSKPVEPESRQSNALRASVLDVALELGFGTNGTISNWMFNNAVDEEVEEEPEDDVAPKESSSPGFDDYITYSTPPTSTESGFDAVQTRGEVSPTAQQQPQVHFPPLQIPPTSTPKKKLRKPRPDGYESDGGYMSDGGKKARARTKSKPTDPGVAFPFGEPTEPVPAPKEEQRRWRKKSSNKKEKDTGAETDVEESGKKVKSPPKSKKSKKVSGDAGYETDDGYISASGKKAKRKFFSLRRKAESPTEETVVEYIPPVPELAHFPLPIASRFATSSVDLPSASASTIRAETPIAPPTRPFASSAASSSVSLISSSNSGHSPLTPDDTFGLRALHPGIPNPFSDAESLYGGHHPDKSVASTISPFPSASTQGPLSAQGMSSPLSGRPILRPIHTASPLHLMTDGAGPAPSRSASPMGSPFVMLTPINTNLPASPRPRDRPLSPSPSEIIPSSDYIVPSRSTSPLPSPNVLAYYDVPPPSPPPTGPLPRIPRGAPPSAHRDPALGVARLRSMSQDRTRARSRSPNPGNNLAASSPDQARPVSPGGLPLGPGVQRGRASPFPTQPLPRQKVDLANRSRADVYRDLYDKRRDADEDDDDDEVGIRVEQWDSDEETGGHDAIFGVMDRFRDTHESPSPSPGSALERKDSGALRPGIGKPSQRIRFAPPPMAPPEEDDDQASRYPDDESNAGGYNRDTVYSSYSRASFMDTDRSQSVRGKLIEHVGLMYEDNGRERSQAIPPVPKLPPDLVAGGNRF
ncbi:unnamed protein product [Mycena citricolor]|uniref:Uncharacterized protein n=1 Tax=Mycena citricolor TaxID=2018698 RepID=A0AAD2H3R3_9AGAR|nr:unnamed protein product [Mycena citricolor]